MIKRPLNKRFSAAVREGRKTTTIRATPWPIGKLIMLYNWTGRPYASKQDDVVAVKVLRVTPIIITHDEVGDMIYIYWPNEDARALWQTEGFESAADMDSWFRPLLKRGEQMQQYLMTFEVVEVSALE